MLDSYKSFIVNFDVQLMFSIQTSYSYICYRKYNNCVTVEYVI